MDRDRNAKSRHFPPGPSRTASGRWLRAMPQACALGSRFPHRCSGMSRRGGLGRVQPGLTPGAPCARWPDQCGEPQWGQEGRGLFCASPEGPGVWSSRGFPTPALPVSRGGGTRGRPSVTPTLPGPVGAACVWRGDRDPEDGSASASLELDTQGQWAAPGPAVVTGNNVSSVFWCSCRGGRKTAARSSSRGLPCQQLPARP